MRVVFASRLHRKCCVMMFCTQFRYQLKALTSPLMVAALALLFVMGTTGAWAQDGTQSLRLYTSMPKAAAEQLAAAFETEHPVIDVQIYRAGTTRIIETIQLDRLTGERGADVILIADEINMEQLNIKGSLRPYPGAPISGLTQGSFDSGRTYFGTKAMSTVLIFDPTKTPRPTAWRDLAATGAGPVAMPNPLTSGSALANLWHLNELLGWDFYQVLAQNGALVLRKNSQVLGAVTDGKASYGMVLDYVAVNAKASGAAIDFVYPEEGVVITYQPAAIAARAHNVAGAETFIDFLLSRDGQRLISDQGYRPLLGDVELSSGYPPDISAFVMRSVDAKAALEQAEQLRFKFNTIFGF